MASSESTSPASSDSWIQSPQWVNRLSANISSLISPITAGTKSDNERVRQPRSERGRPVTWHVSSDTLIYPQLDVSVAAPAPLIRESSLRRKKKEVPPMPTGEHHAAARSRLRNKAERRGNRSRSRRPELNPTQSLRSSRRHSSASQRDAPQILSAEQVRAQKQRNRKSSPLPLPSTSHVMSVGNFKLLKELTSNRRTSPPSDALKGMPAPSDLPLFNDLWMSEEQQYMERAALLSRQRRVCNVDKLLISPKTRFPKPTILSPPLKSPPTTFGNHIPVLRKKRDIAHVPASAKWYLWQILIDEKAPLVLTNIQVDRRYSDGLPATGWSIDTPTPRILGLPIVPMPDLRKAYSRNFRGDFCGQRKYDRDSGFWEWTEGLL